MDGVPKEEKNTENGPQDEVVRLRPLLDKTILTFLTKPEFTRGHTKTYRLRDAIQETYSNFVREHPNQTHLQIQNSIISDYPDFELSSLEQVEGYNDDDLTFEQFCGRANLYIIEQALKKSDNFQTKALFETFTKEVIHRENKYKHELQDGED